MYNRATHILTKLTDVFCWRFMPKEETSVLFWSQIPTEATKWNKRSRDCCTDVLNMTPNGSSMGPCCLLYQYNVIRSEIMFSKKSGIRSKHRGTVLSKHYGTSIHPSWKFMIVRPNRVLQLGLGFRILIVWIAGSNPLRGMFHH